MEYYEAIKNNMVDLHVLRSKEFQDSKRKQQISE